MQTGAVIAIQDMGAAGLTSSAVEMGAKGNLGVRLDLDNVPCRETGMTAYEMMLSESQERMLMVLNPEHWDEARAIFEKWELESAIVGETTDDLRFRVWHDGVEEANLPIKDLGDEAPIYDRPWVEPAASPALTETDLAAPADVAEALMALIGSANGCSRRWVWEQYDHVISGNVIGGPGGDAAVVRIGDGPVALAMTVDVSPRYCQADPFEGGKQAVAEAWRNLTAVGATPLALTDNLNFGAATTPEIMGQFVRAIHGIGEAARDLEFPVVSGNVSLYNQTDGRSILPTPAIGGVGRLADVTRRATLAWAAGDTIYLVGGHGEHLGQSLYLDVVQGIAQRAAAGRGPRAGAAPWRRGPRSHRRGHRQGLPRHLVGRAGHRAGGDGDGVGHRRTARHPGSRCTSTSSPRIRGATCWPRPTVTACCWRPARPASPSPPSVWSAARRLRSRAGCSIPVAAMVETHEAYLPAMMAQP